MSLDRRSFNTLLAGLPLAAAAPDVLAQTPRDSVTLGLVLEPLGLDPTTSSASSIGEISHLNIFEGLTRINQDGAVLPLLAEAWDHDVKASPTPSSCAGMSGSPTANPSRPPP